MAKKKLAKQCMAAFLSFTMMFSVFPTSAVNAAGEGETTVGTTQTIACSKFVQAGINGDKTGTGEKKAAMIGTKELTTTGSEKAAARVEGETAYGSNNVLSTRVAAMGFVLPKNKISDSEAGIDPEQISRAELTITVQDGNNTLSDGKKTKAAIFQVDSEKYAQLASDETENAPGSTFLAKDNDYSKDKTVYGGGLGGSEGWIEHKNQNQDLNVTFDVTNWVKESINAGDPYAIYRLQTVICGYYVYKEGPQAPKLSITTVSEQEAVDAAKAELTLPATTKTNLTLPATGSYGTEITWISDKPTVIANDGTVTRQQADVDVVLTATIKKGQAQTTKEITVQVLKQSEVTPIAAYQFTADDLTDKVIEDTTGNDYDAELKGNGAEITEGMLSLPGGKNDSDAAYVALPGDLFEKQDTLTITTWLKNETGAGDYAAMFFGTKTKHVDSASTANMPLNYWLLNPSKGGKFKSVWTDSNNADKPYSTETAVSNAQTSDQWALYTTVITPERIIGYYNGEEVCNNPKTKTTTDFGTGLVGFIGRSSYNDMYYKGGVFGVKVYDEALTQEEIYDEYYNNTPPVVKKQDLYDSIAEEVLAAMLNKNDSKDAIVTDLLFTKSKRGVTLTWTSSDTAVIDAEGKVLYSGDEGKKVNITLTGTFKGQEVFKKVVAVTVQSEFSADVAALTIPNMDDIRGNITLPKVGKYGSAITWDSDKEEVISTEEKTNEGYDSTPAGVVTRQNTDTKVKLTATITKDQKTKTKVFDVTVKAKTEVGEMTDYIFAYFIGDGAGQEKIFFASSENGLDWEELYDGKPLLTSELGTKGLRDPYIFRSAEGDKFYLIATDLQIAAGEGWTAAQQNGSQAIMVWESEDLVNWSDQRMVTVSDKIQAGCTWAPEVFYDDKTGEYIVFWASKVASLNYDKQRLYYCKTRDFHSFTEPKKWIDENHNAIDTTVVRDDDNTYYRFTKNEDNGAKYVYMEKSNSLLGEWTKVNDEQYKDGDDGVEGPCCFRFNDDDIANAGAKWCLLLDNFGNGGYFPMTTNDLANEEFKKITNAKLPSKSKPRHGTVMNITRAEYEAVMQVYSSIEVIDDKLPDAVLAGSNYQLPAELKISVFNQEKTVAVTWEAVAEGAFDQPGTVTVKGTIAELKNREITHTIEVVSDKLIYYIDSGVGSWNNDMKDSASFDAIAGLDELELRNEEPDKLYATDSWGFVNDADQSIAGCRTSAKESIYENGWWAKAGKNCEYIIPLESGTYTVTGYFGEWWDVTRPMNFYVEYTDDNGKKVTSEAKLVEVSKSAKQQKAAIKFKVENVVGTAEVHFLAVKAGEQAPVIAGLAVEQLENGQADAVAKAALNAVTVPATKNMKAGDTAKIDIKYPENFTQALQAAGLTVKSTTYSSDKETVAKVSEDGTITAVAEGTAKITTKIVLSDDTEKVLTTTITVEKKTPAVISVTGVTMSSKTLTLTEGKSGQLTAKVAPENATNKNVTWKSDNEKVAKVSSTGRVTAVKAGTTKITVTTVDGKKTATCTVTVKANKVSVKSVKLNKTKLTMGVKETFTLKATVAPKNATNKKVSWKIDKKGKKFVTMKNGKLTAKKKGKATITATVDGKKATCKVTVKPAPTKKAKVTLNKKKVTLKVKKTFQIKPKVSSKFGSATFKYSIDKKGKKAVKVDKNGKVTAKKKGKATITVKTYNGKAKATLKITVK